MDWNHKVFSSIFPQNATVTNLEYRATHLGLYSATVGDQSLAYIFWSLIASGIPFRIGPRTFAGHHSRNLYICDQL